MRRAGGPPERLVVDPVPRGERPAPVEDDRPDHHARMVCALPAGPRRPRAAGGATAPPAAATWAGAVPGGAPGGGAVPAGAARAGAVPAGAARAGAGMAAAWAATRRAP